MKNCQLELTPPLFDIRAGSFWDEDTGLFWYEIGHWEEGGWFSILISGVEFETRQDADAAADRQVPIVTAAIEKRLSKIYNSGGYV